jgi:hypothetical protein
MGKKMHPLDEAVERLRKVARDDPEQSKKAFKLADRLASHRSEFDRLTANSRRMGRHARAEVREEQLDFQRFCHMRVQQLRSEKVKWTAAFEQCGDEQGISGEHVRRLYSREKNRLASNQRKTKSRKRT